MKSIRGLYGSHHGKVSDKWDYYLDQYDDKFSKFKALPIKLLEIGIQNGGSLEIWDKYFSGAEMILGCDINPNCANLVYQAERIKILVGDANEAKTKEKILAHSNRYDLIIDDGSHTSPDIVKSFANYFPYLNDGGLYVVEDLHCSYWQPFTGGLFHPLSSMAFLKKLVDISNFEAWGVTKDRASILRIFELNYGLDFSTVDLDHLYSVEFGNSMCFIQKKKPEKNLLGAELIVGSNPTVEGRVNPNLSSPRVLVTPDQHNNPWSNGALTPEEEVLKLRRLVSGISNSFDPIGNVTVVLNNRNLLSWPKAMIERILQFKSLAEIIIVDNDSTYEPLLEWYLTIPHRIIRVKNIGHQAPWVPEINSQIKTDFYIVSDPDLDLSSTPIDCIEHLAMCLIRFKEMGKVGLGLDISTVPKESPYFSHVNSHEKQFWDLPLIANLIRPAPVDTTFAIYNKKLMNFYQVAGGRADMPYMARHLPWEIVDKDDEFSHYLQHANESSSYKSFIGNRK